MELCKPSGSSHTWWLLFLKRKTLDSIDGQYLCVITSAALLALHAHHKLVLEGVSSPCSLVYLGPVVSSVTCLFTCMPSWTIW